MYLYLQSKGGFNDILRNVVRSIDFCRKHQRILLFDFKNTIYNVNFSDYFFFEDENEEYVIINGVTIIYNFLTIKQILLENESSVSPIEYQNKMNDILYKDYLKNVRIKLPENNCNTSNNVLIFSNPGDGGNSFHFFKKIKYKNEIKEYVKNNLEKIPKPYISFQIRNTDWKCDYESMCLQNNEIINRYDYIYVATDDKCAVDNLRNKYGNKIYNFTNFPKVKYHNLHNSKLNPDIKMKDLISDIFLLLNSEKIFSNSKGIFIKLVNMCFKNQTYFKEKLL